MRFIDILSGVGREEETGSANQQGGGFPVGTMVENPPANAGDAGSIHGSGRSPGEGNENPLQYSCLGNAMDREAWWAIVHRIVKESEVT